MTISPANLAKALSIAEHWAVHDPDPQTKNETISLINLVTMGEPSAEEAVVSQFGKRLAFGTAGLRGEIGAGPSRMNKMVVMQTSAAFAKWLWARSKSGGASNPPSIVVGFDARTKSDVFAKAAAEVFAGAGLKTLMLPGPLPTPLTAFAVRHLNTSAGIMITASHNPPNDNGYKIYLGDEDDGSQIASPTDQEISVLIDEVANIRVADIPLLNTYEFVGDEIFTAYSDAIAKSWDLPRDDSKLKVVYTPLHGVGSTITQKIFIELGLPKLHLVEEQDSPDATFPTVKFPNPEEPGALDLAYAKGRSLDADLIIAHDPDADRLAVAVADKNTEAGFTMLTGNQLGLLLGLQAAKKHSRLKQEDAPRGSLACTVVSSPALEKVAAAYDLNYRETLPGFKWVSRVPDLVFGFEEALGYLTRPNLVKDKDGISAAVDLMHLALELESVGKTLSDALTEATAKFGAFASSQVTIRLQNQADVAELSSSIRKNPPKEFADTKVLRLLDFNDVDDLTASGITHLRANILKFTLADDSRIMIRPSGTEAKLKIYIDTFSDVGDAKTRNETATNKLLSLAEGIKTVLNLPLT